MLRHPCLGRDKGEAVREPFSPASSAHPSAFCWISVCAYHPVLFFLLLQGKTGNSASSGDMLWLTGVSRRLTNNKIGFDQRGCRAIFFAIDLLKKQIGSFFGQLDFRHSNCG